MRLPIGAPARHLERPRHDPRGCQPATFADSRQVPRVARHEGRRQALSNDLPGRATAIASRSSIRRACRTNSPLVELATVDDAVRAIADMIVRGAPLIGATGAYGMALALLADATTPALEEARRRLLATRPTAVNLRWAVDEVVAAVAPLPAAERAAAAFRCAAELCDEDVAGCASIGEYGKQILAELASKRPGRPVNVLTHCNAGWLATVDYGTALAPGLQGARRGHPPARLGGRDAAAQPGRIADRLGAGPARGAAHRDRRQRRRAPHAARPGRRVHRRLGPHDRGRRRVQQDRHVPEGAGRARLRRALLRGAARVHHRLDHHRRASRRSRSRSAAPTRCAGCGAAPPRARWCPSTSFPTAAPPPTRPSTSRPRVWSPAYHRTRRLSGDRAGAAAPVSGDVRTGLSCSADAAAVAARGWAVLSLPLALRCIGV